MHAAILDNHDVTGLPIDPFAVMDVMAAAFEDVEHGAVQVTVLLPVSARCIDLDMRLDRLGDGRRLRTDDVFSVKLRPTFPGKIAGRIDARLLDQRLVAV